MEYCPSEKIRIRFSLLPQGISTLVEPHTPKIIDRIKAIDRFKKAGYEVHINFSPIIVYDGWLKGYEELFKTVDTYVEDKDNVLAECIFLTHNKEKHFKNLKAGRKGEELLWNPRIQETKTSQYGGSNLRYKVDLKSKWIEEFSRLHDNIIPWNTIRYIF